MIKALVIDDEHLARENLKLLISDFCDGIEVIGTAQNITEAKALIESTNPDVIFLDIRMPSGAEGFDLIDSLEEINFDIVFVTAFKDYAIQAFKANAIDYVLKPVEIEELQKTAVRIIRKHNLPKSKQEDNKERFHNAFESISNEKIDKIVIQNRQGIKIIEIKKIVHLKSESNYTHIYFEDGSKYTDSKTLKTFEEILPSFDFMRVHHSHIVNLNQIDEYSTDQGHFLLMKNGDHISVSRANLDKLLNYFKTLPQ